MTRSASIWDAIAARIGAATGQPFRVQRQRSVSGGCINTAAVLHDGARGYFVKLNTAARLTMFEAEAEGLTALAAPDAIRVPAPVCVGVIDGPMPTVTPPSPTLPRKGGGSPGLTFSPSPGGRGPGGGGLNGYGQSYLVMEWLDLSGRLDGARAGRQLAQLHRATAAAFGWHRDNTIGSTPQPNAPCGDWVDFWRERRLGHQLRLAAANGYGGRLQSLGERLLADLDALLGHDPAPSLLHGDLWGGNIGATPDGQPVIFDPAVYHGDRETDLAMTELFGGFGADFQAAYCEAWPLDPGYAIRKILYNLYHVLNHLNLFGGGYLHQSQSMIERLLAEIR